MTPSEKLYREIPLTHGQVAIVDAADYEWISQFNWHADWNPTSRSYYARRNYFGMDGHSHVLQMHRAILGLGQYEKRQCDHRDRNTLNNCRSNLRIATHEENMRNRAMYKSNTTGFKGVCWVKGKLKWRAEIQVNKKRHNLGYFPTAEEAYAAYVAAVPKHHGEFACM